MLTNKQKQWSVHVDKKSPLLIWMTEKRRTNMWLNIKCRKDSSCLHENRLICFHWLHYFGTIPIFMHAFKEKHTHAHRHLDNYKEIEKNRITVKAINLWTIRDQLLYGIVRSNHIFMHFHFNHSVKWKFPFIQCYCLLFQIKYVLFSPFGLLFVHNGQFNLCVVFILSTK